MCLCAQLLCGIWLFEAPWTAAHQAALSMDSPDKNTGVGCHFLLQGVFPIQDARTHISGISCVARGFLLLRHWGVLSWTYNLSFKWLKWEWCNNGNRKCSCKLHKLILKARNIFCSQVLFDLNNGGLLCHINSSGKNQ